MNKKFNSYIISFLCLFLSIIHSSISDFPEGCIDKYMCQNHTNNDLCACKCLTGLGGSYFPPNASNISDGISSQWYCSSNYEDPSTGKNIPYYCDCYGCLTEYSCHCDNSSCVCECLDGFGGPYSLPDADLITNYNTKNQWTCDNIHKDPNTGKTIPLHCSVDITPYGCSSGYVCQNNDKNSMCVCKCLSGPGNSYFLPNASSISDGLSSQWYCSSNYKDPSTGKNIPYYCDCYGCLTEYSCHCDNSSCVCECLDGFGGPYSLPDADLITNYTTKNQWTCDNIHKDPNTGKTIPLHCSVDITPYGCSSGYVCQNNDKNSLCVCKCLSGPGNSYFLPNASSISDGLSSQWYCSSNYKDPSTGKNIPYYCDCYGCTTQYSCHYEKGAFCACECLSELGGQYPLPDSRVVCDSSEPPWQFCDNTHKDPNTGETIVPLHCST